ncbi:hypothetical protein [Streptomyces cacaoi]|uniref:hypothetical protein n=1 Tax=Streptomyces cacaoi TaxID=1898 RepID=UPI0011F3B5F7|nr:hypothetical protein [Streptomyces cacaoi]
MTLPAPFEPDEFDRITSRLPRLTPLQAAWDEAAEMLQQARPGGVDVEDIGHIALDCLPEHERDAALDELFRTWAGVLADHDTTERGEAA